jgi:hypothetical protein
MPPLRAASHFLPENGEQILDLCAAPGGKTTHILEAAPEARCWPSMLMSSVFPASMTT